MFFGTVERPPRLSEFELEVPEKLIAQYPSKKREECKLMVLNKKDGSIEHKQFKDIIHYLMVAHYKNDVDLFVEDTEKFIKKDEINISFVKNWLIFKKFYKKKKFKKILDEKK